MAALARNSIRVLLTRYEPRPPTQLTSSSRAPTPRLPLFNAFASVAAPSSASLRLPSRAQKTQKSAASQWRGIASTSSAGAVVESSSADPPAPSAIEPVVAAPIPEPAPVQEGALPLADSFAPAVEAAVPPPAEALPESETLVDAANVAMANLSGTLDLSSLDGSWGLHPIMRMQSMFIQMHESFPLLGTALPWFILIPTITLGLRLLLFTFQVRAQANAARMAIIQPQMLAGMEKLKAAKARGDFMGAQTAQIETQQLMAFHNVNPIRNLAFPLAQAAVFMTMFFALKGLAGAGIPSMSTEGFGWVQDLTLPDPYWVLPIASTTLTLATLELGVDSTTQVQTSTTKNMKLFFRVMLVVALPFIAYFPAALLMYWVTNNSISLAQSLILKQPVVRGIFGIPTIPPKKQPGEVGYIPEPSFSEAFKNVQMGMSEKWEETKEKGEKEAARQREFSVASQGSEMAPVYAPKISSSKKIGILEQASQSLTEEYSDAAGSSIVLTPSEQQALLFGRNKAKRAATARAKRASK